MMYDIRRIVNVYCLVLVMCLSSDRRATQRFDSRSRLLPNNSLFRGLHLALGSTFSRGASMTDELAL